MDQKVGQILQALTLNKMNKEETLRFLKEKGITKLCVDHPNTPKTWVLEYLESSDNDDDFKEYYREFINFHFK